MFNFQGASHLISMIFIIFRFLGSSVPQVSFAIISNPPPFVNPIFSSFFFFFSLSSTLPGVAFWRYSFLLFLAPFLSCKCWCGVGFWVLYVEMEVILLAFLSVQTQSVCDLNKEHFFLNYFFFILHFFICFYIQIYIHNEFCLFSFWTSSFPFTFYPLRLVVPPRHLPLLQGEAE